MMFLSGVFFDNDLLPGWVSNITEFLPLTPLVESLRESALYGTNTFELLPQLIIILAWIMVAFGVGVKTFKWEWFLSYPNFSNFPSSSSKPKPGLLLRWIWPSSILYGSNNKLLCSGINVCECSSL